MEMLFGGAVSSSSHQAVQRSARGGRPCGSRGMQRERAPSRPGTVAICQARCMQQWRWWCLRVGSLQRCSWIDGGLEAPGCVLCLEHPQGA